MELGCSTTGCSCRPPWYATSPSNVTIYDCPMGTCARNAVPMEEANWAGLAASNSRATAAFAPLRFRLITEIASVEPSSESRGEVVGGEVWVEVQDEVGVPAGVTRVAVEDAEAVLVGDTVAVFVEDEVLCADIVELLVTLTVAVWLLLEVIAGVTDPVAVTELLAP